MTRKPYGLFCPISKACEVLEPRWTIQILGELWGGSTRFNEIRRGIPGISPSLLSRRLKEMQEADLLERVEDKATGAVDYFRTEKARALEPILDGMGRWAQRYIDAETAVSDTDAGVLMWSLRNKILVENLPPKRNVLRFNFSDATSKHTTYWVITKPGEPPEICKTDPGFDIDLFIETEVTVLTAVLLGRRSLSRAIDNDRIFLSGDARLSRTMGDWLLLNMYAGVEGTRVAEDEEPRLAAGLG